MNRHHYLHREIWKRRCKNDIIRILPHRQTVSTRKLKMHAQDHIQVRANEHCIRCSLSTRLNGYAFLGHWDTRKQHAYRSSTLPDCVSPAWHVTSTKRHAARNARKRTSAHRSTSYATGRRPAAPPKERRRQTDTTPGEEKKAEDDDNTTDRAVLTDGRMGGTLRYCDVQHGVFEEECSEVKGSKGKPAARLPAHIK